MDNVEESRWKCAICGVPIKPGGILCGSHKCFMRYTGKMAYSKKKQPEIVKKESWYFEMEVRRSRFDDPIDKGNF